jgi:putative ABC transport system substrate-binding protein
MDGVLRRHLLIAAGALLCAPFAANAQQLATARRIAFLSAGSPSTGPNPWLDAFRQRLRELGHEDGRNFKLEARHAEGKTERLPELASELARQKVDIIIATSTFATRAAKQATTTIPIVMSVFDALADGLVSNLARPGGNVTGRTAMSTELMGKRFQLLKEAVPGVTRMAFLIQRRLPGAFGTQEQLEQSNRAYMESYGAAAQPLGIALYQVQAMGADEIRGVFPTLVRDRAQALYVIESPELVLHRALIAELAIQHRLPTLFGNRRLVDAGGLMAYSPHMLDEARVIAGYVDKILKGAKPGDLPVEQPTRLELVINLKTAKALGLAIPQSLLLRADHVIE